MIDGAVLFAEIGIVTNLRYRIECARDWSARRAEVSGWIGERDVDVVMIRTDGGWTVQGVPMLVENVAGLCDVDLGFTPATNTNAIRRLNLGVGQEAETTALWLDVDNWSVKPLRQIYRRLEVDRYEYVSPDNDYRAVLTVDDAGMVTDYPDLWVAEVLGD